MIYAVLSNGVFQHVQPIAVFGPYINFQWSHGQLDYRVHGTPEVMNAS